MKMKMKERFKNALFAFFKEEIDAEVRKKILCLEKEHRKFFIKEENVKLIEISDKIIIKNNEHIPFGYDYLQKLDKVKKRIFDIVMEHAIIDTESVLGSYQVPLDCREIKITLLVGSKAKF